jgi:1-acyl-sn-glycerol-3-phosphate acyltransferase
VKGLYRLSLIVLNVVFRAFFRFRVYGRENIPRGRALIAANHQSYIDPTAIGASIPEEMSYLAREDVFNLAAFRWLCVKLNTILIKKRRADRSALKEVLKRLSEGWKVLVFPEGTRSYDGQLQPPEHGISLLAHRSGVPVIPTYVSGTYDVLPRGGGMIRFHPISVSFGPALKFDEGLLKAGARAAYRAFSHKVMEAIAELKVRLERGAG